MSLGQNFGLVLGFGLDSGSQAAIQIDSAYVFETSGEAFICRFVSPVNQTNGNLTFYAYASAITGSPDFDAEVRNGPAGGDDLDRPENGGSTLDTVAGVVPVAGTWSTFPFTNLTLVQGQQYYIIVHNAHATPASNHASWNIRGATDGHPNMSTVAAYMFQTGYTTDGFTSDPSVTGASQGTAVIKFDDDTKISFPYVGSESHASNTNDRGNRITFLENIKVLGHKHKGTTTSMDEVAIRQGASTVITVPTDAFAEGKSSGALYGPLELTKALAYDFIIGYASNSTSGNIYNMGEAEGDLPADVLACRQAGGYVDGVAGSYTVDLSKIAGMYLWLDDLVAAAGGAGGLLTHPGMAGGNRG